jgi:alpha-ketoglutarate-dependent taurine dioxygenase
MVQNLQIEPLAASFGARVTGVMLAELDEFSWRALYDAWLRYALLIFPGQKLNREQQVTFARRFGALEFALAPISNVKADGSLRDETDDDVV